MIKHIEKKEELLEEVKSGVTLIDFFATWCGPCKMLTPVLEEFDESHSSEIKIIKVDVDKGVELAAEYGIQAVPTLILVNEGKEIKRTMGYQNINALKDFCKF